MAAFARGLPEIATDRFTIWPGLPSDNYRLFSRGLRMMVWSFSGPSSHRIHSASSNIRRRKKQPTGSGLCVAAAALALG